MRNDEDRLAITFLTDRTGAIHAAYFPDESTEGAPPQIWLSGTDEQFAREVVLSRDEIRAFVARGEIDRYRLVIDGERTSLVPIDAN